MLKFNWRKTTRSTKQFLLVLRLNLGFGVPRGKIKGDQTDSTFSNKHLIYCDKRTQSLIKHRAINIGNFKLTKILEKILKSILLKQKKQSKALDKNLNMMFGTSSTTNN